MKVALRSWRPAPRRRPAVGGPSAAMESTLSELAWQRRRRATWRWAWVGAVVGALVAVPVFAPAAWLARAVTGATDGRLLLADARGSVWSGSAVPVLTGGADSRTASALPGRLGWSLRMRGVGLELVLRQACCLDGDIVLRWSPGLTRQQWMLSPGPTGAVGRWPAAWLAGLGTPFNTMQLSGTMRLTTPGLTVERVQGRTLIAGSAQVELLGASSRLSTLDPLGSYRLSLQGDAGGGDARVTLETLEGALQLGGQGQFTAGHLRFRGEASAASGSEVALDNLLNLIGRRTGARAVISIG